MISTEWSIQSRTAACSATGEPFKEGEYFYTLLFDETTGFRREDLSETAFKARAAEDEKPFSFWRSKFEPSAPPPPEALGKQSAEDLLRRYMEDPGEHLAKTRYILALMLERKRMLKEVETKRTDDGALLRIYEHAKTGEVFLIPDPQLHLDQIAEVQAEVAAQLAPG